MNMVIAMAYRYVKQDSSMLPEPSTVHVMTSTEKHTQVVAGGPCVYFYRCHEKNHFELYIHNPCLIYDKFTRVQTSLSLSYMLTAFKVVRLCRKMTFILFL
jgi:hypothetical protein